MYYLVASGVVSMFWRRKRKEQAKKAAENEAVIEAIKQDTFDKIEEAADQTRKLNNYLDHGGITELLVVAIGRKGKH